MKIAEQIKEARLKNNLTQEQAAESLLVSRQTISNWENGRSLPDIVSILRMSELYGLSVDELLKGDKAIMEKIKKDDERSRTMKKMFRFAWFSVAAGAVMMILGQIFEGNPAIEFINGALPWVLLGILFLMSFIYFDSAQPDQHDQIER